MDSKELIIEAGYTANQYGKDWWCDRQLFYFLAWRDILLRYKQTEIGIAKALLRAFLAMVVFSSLMKLPSKRIHFPILVFVAMLPWQLFSTVLTECRNSLITKANLICQVNFRRLIMLANVRYFVFISGEPYLVVWQK